MPDIQNPIDEHATLREFWEKVDLVLYLIVIAVVTPTVAKMLATAYQSGGLGRATIISIKQLAGVPHYHVTLASLGAYTGLVTLLLFDEMKRIQGVLLLIASAIAFVMLRSQGLLYPLYPLQNLHVPVIGFVAGFVLGGGYKMRGSEPPYEFRGATVTLFWVLTGIIGAGFIEKHLFYSASENASSALTIQSTTAVANISLFGAGLFVDLIATSTFFVGAHMFMSYEAKTDVFVMGVQRAGKTLMAAGLVIAADEEVENTPLNPSGPLSRLVTSLQTADEGWGNEEYTGPTVKGKYHLLQFKTRAGELFKEYVEIDVLDYAGEYLNKDLVQIVSTMVPKSRFSRNWFVYMYEELRGLPDIPEEASNLESGEVQRVLAKQIIHSDTLVIIVDSGSLVSNLPYGDEDYQAQQNLSEYVDTYVQILRHVNQSLLDEKEVVLVATKADYLYQLYRKTNSHLDFFNWVNYHLLESREGREKLGPLLTQAQVNRVYPVYYDLDHQSSIQEGEPVPEHPIEVHGNTELLNRLKEGA